jgi:hypothetical protein
VTRRTDRRGEEQNFSDGGGEGRGGDLTELAPGAGKGVVHVCLHVSRHTLNQKLSTVQKKLIRLLVFSKPPVMLSNHTTRLSRLRRLRAILLLYNLLRLLCTLYWRKIKARAPWQESPFPLILEERQIP